MKCLLQGQGEAAHEGYTRHGITVIDLILGVEQVVAVHPKLYHIGQLIGYAGVPEQEVLLNIGTHSRVETVHVLQTGAGMPAVAGVRAAQICLMLWCTYYRSLHLEVTVVAVGCE